ncbi:MAG: nuclear transport factor 2 family protein [Bryobacterales bacterium]|nr:nuclear transport factor 2 family protein [Bryobacterales bacterium]
MSNPAVDPHAADREQLIAILRQIEASINAQSLESMVARMDPNATVVWANAEVSRGPREILAYYHRMVQAPGRILTRYTTKASLSAPARFLGGDVAIADGSMEDEFFPILRGPFRLSNRWTTTLSKASGEWKVVSLHLSGNVFNNVLLDEAKRALLYVGAGGLALGALAGWLLARL